MADKRTGRRAGFYWEQDQPFVSVTTVLKIIDKPALRYWFGKEVYYALAKQPDLNQKEALAAPYKKSKDAMQRGTIVHSIVENWTKTGDVMDVDEQWRGYAQGFKDWLEQFSCHMIEHEKTVINREHRYAGTLDLLADVSGKRAIIDIKTGKDIYAEAGLQLSAYKHCDNVEAERIGVCLLQDDGTFKFQWMPDDFDAFLHAKALWEWNNKEMLTKVGY